MPQLRPSVGLTWDHGTGQSQGYRLYSCHVVCGGFTNPRIASTSVVIASAQVGVQKADANLGHCPISSTLQFTSSPVFSSHPFAKNGRKGGYPARNGNAVQSVLLGGSPRIYAGGGALQRSGRSSTSICALAPGWRDPRAIEYCISSVRIRDFELSSRTAFRP